MCTFFLLFFLQKTKTEPGEEGWGGGVLTNRQTEKAGKRNKQTNTSTSEEVELFGEGTGIFISWC